MRKTLMGICALLLFSSFGMLSGIAQVQAIDSQANSIQRLEMSDDEKERRRQVCDNEEAACRDWCARSKQGQECYKKCWNNYVECLKKIPSNPVEDPDY